MGIGSFYLLLYGLCGLSTLGFVGLGGLLYWWGRRQQRASRPKASDAVAARESDTALGEGVSEAGAPAKDLSQRT